MKRYKCPLIVILFVLLLPFLLPARWVGENAVYASLNPEGLANELIFSYRIDFPDKDYFLLSDAHLDIGFLSAIYPVGFNKAARVQFSPLLFLDVGFMAGVHGTWRYFAFADNTPITAYGESVRDTMEHSTKFLPYISPFFTLKGKVGKFILYTSFFFEKWYNNEKWFNWYYEVMHKNGWLFNWNGYLMWEFSKSFSLLFKSFYLHSYDTGETKFSAGPGCTVAVSSSSKLAFFCEYHFERVNYSGVKLGVSLITTFDWR